MSCQFSEERETKLAEFRERIALLGEELEGLAESKLLKEEAFLVRFFFSNRTLQDNTVLTIKIISGFYEEATGTISRLPNLPFFL